MKRIPARFLQRHEHRTLALLLLLLHLVIWWDFGGGMSRSLMLAHLGLFLLWQPLLRHEQHLTWRKLLGLALVPLAIVSALSWLLLGFWLLLLIGLVGGRVNVPARRRIAYLTALVFLVIEFLIGWAPRMFAMDSPGNDFMDVFRFGLFALPVAILLMPGDDRLPPPGPSVDFLYGLAVCVLSIIVALGSLVSTLSVNTPYPVAIIQSVMAIALFLLAVTWMWAPMAGFSGLGQLWERYVQNAGTPFELWLHDLQRNAGASESPQRFLDVALERLHALPWVAGLDWHDDAREGSLGETTAHVFRSRSGVIVIAIYSYRRMGTALMLHARLLVQMIGHFHRAKIAELERAEQAHVRAIYETGARMTHDIKNLLQSLKAMTGAVEHARGSNARAASQLVLRQLPHITQRLQLALDKLESPQRTDAVLTLASRWWHAIRERNANLDIEFVDDLDGDPVIPSDLFDNVTENLIENARFKRQSEPGVRVRIRLRTAGGYASLEVTDDGSPVPDAVRAQLFRAAVRSAGGLGIGLYQAARYAEECGYRLRLDETATGVAFVLEPAAPAHDADVRARATLRTPPSATSAG